MRALAKATTAAAVLVLILAAAFFPSSAAAGQSESSIVTHAADFGRIPFAFVQNRGQVDQRVLFYLHGGQGSIFFTRNGFVYDLVQPKPGGGKERTVFAVTLDGASPGVRVRGAKKLDGHVTYLKGGDPRRWHSRVPLYEEVFYENIYPGVDLRIYGRDDRMEYDFIVRPGADPSVIAMAVRGAQRLSLDGDGRLLIRTRLLDLYHSAPVAYQPAGGTRDPVAVGFRLEDGLVRFAAGKFDRARDLVIDPVSLSYWSYLGGSGSEEANGIAVDGAGYIYVTGVTDSLDFPLEEPYESTFVGGDQDVFVTKFSPDGTSLVYSTYLGGGGLESAGGLAVDATGHAFVAGTTDSTDFPTANAYDATFNANEDAYLVKLSPSGDALVFATYLGGSSYDWLSYPTITSDAALDIAVGPHGNAYVVGVTGADDFPVVKAYQSENESSLGGANCFVTKFSADGTSLVYSTYLGGSHGATCHAVAVDAADSAYVTGQTDSSDFPMVNALQSTYGGWFSDAFVTKFTPAGNALAYSTYLGGSSSDSAQDIAVDSGGRAVVVGSTGSPEFPLVNAYQSTLKKSDAFVIKLNADGKTAVYSTFLGGDGNPADGNFFKRGSDGASAVAVDASGAAVVTGKAGSPDFPLAGAYYDGRYEYADTFVTKIAPDGAALAWSTRLTQYAPSFFGEGTGIVLDVGGNVLVCGHTREVYPFFLPTAGRYQAQHAGGGQDAFVAKLVAQEAPPRELVASAGTGGRIVSEPGGIDCRGRGPAVGGCSAFFPYAATVTLSAVADSGYEFTGWGYDCEAAATCELDMEAMHFVSAGFQHLPGEFHRLSVTVGGGGTVTSDPAGIDCGSDCSEDYLVDTPVALTAMPDDGWQFDGWSGDCSGTGACALSMAGARSVSAAFSRTPSRWHSLTVGRTGSGTVTSNPPGIDCGGNCTAEFLDTLTVTLSAAPAAGWQFDGWSGDCSGPAACDLDMEADRSVTAAFSQLQTPTLTVIRNGSGTVTSDLTGIACGSDCSEALPYGTRVRLTALPDPGWVFDGWIGPCESVGDACEVQLTENTRVAATFLGWVYGSLTPDGGGSYDGWTYHGSCVNSDGIWLVGGVRDQASPTWNALNHVGTYAPGANNWKTDFPALGLGRVYLAAACSDDHVFALGGRSPPADAIYDRVEKLALPGGASWQTQAKLPAGRVFGEAVIDGGYLYYLGGAGDAGGLNETTTLWRYDIGTDTWTTTLAQIPVNLAYMSAAVLNGRIYIPGDYDTSTTCVYDIAANTWYQIPFAEGMPPAAHYRCIAVGHEIWRIGGVVGLAAVDSVWALDTFSETWYQFPVPINVARISHSAGCTGLRVGVAGGVAFPGFGNVRLTEYLDLADSDRDLLWDRLELASCLDPLDADTDDDGIPDGIEDVNRNGMVDAGETDFCSADTDLDGLPDGTELGYTAAQAGVDTDPGVFRPDVDPSTTTDPLDADSDGDGLSDGSEDANHNGRIDPGETDPNAAGIYYVAPGADCNGRKPCFGSVQEAVSAAAAPVVIRIAESDYAEAAVVSVENPLTIHGGCTPLDFAATSRMSSVSRLELHNGEVTLRNIALH